MASVSWNSEDCWTASAVTRGTRSSWLGCATSGIGWASSWVKVNGVVALTRLEREVHLLAFEDFAGGFWGRVPVADDAAGATGTLDFPRVIMLSIKAEERRKTE